MRRRNMSTSFLSTRQYRPRRKSNIQLAHMWTKLPKSVFTKHGSVFYSPKNAMTKKPGYMVVQMPDGRFATQHWK